MTYAIRTGTNDKGRRIFLTTEGTSSVMRYRAKQWNTYGWAKRKLDELRTALPFWAGMNLTICTIK